MKIASFMVAERGEKRKEYDFHAFVWRVIASKQSERVNLKTNARNDAYYNIKNKQCGKTPCDVLRHCLYMIIGIGRG